jgi:hypothetical protein
MNELKELVNKYESAIKELENHCECLKGSMTCMKEETTRTALLGIINKLNESQLYITNMLTLIDLDIREEMFDVFRIMDKERRDCITWINLTLMMGDLGDIKLNKLWSALIKGSGLVDILVKFHMVLIIMDKYSTKDKETN